MYPNLVKAIPYLLALALLSYLGSKLYNQVYESGANSIQVKWDKEKKNQADAIIEMKQKMLVKEREHQKQSEKINHDLSKANQVHAVAMATLRSDYDKRLQLASKRYGIYQAAGVSSSAECRSLSSHAIELDRTLEQGRFLVRELRETLGLRDRQVSALGEQILNDRRVISDGN